MFVEGLPDVTVQRLAEGDPGRHHRHTSFCPSSYDNFLDRIRDKRLGHAFLVRVNDQFLSALDAQLVKNSGEMMAYRDGRDACLVGDFLIGQPLRDKPYNASLSLCQRCRPDGDRDLGGGGTIVSACRADVRRRVDESADGSEDELLAAESLTRLHPHPVGVFAAYPVFHSIRRARGFLHEEPFLLLCESTPPRSDEAPYPG